MFSALFWLYLINATLIINHEIDAAYWHEWKLIKSKMGISGFLLLHLLLVPIVLYGLILVYQQTFAGFIASLLLSLTGIAVFLIHLYFFKKGRPEFRTPASIFILVSILIGSLVQGIITIVSSSF